MANKNFHSSQITFIDRTDERKLEVYINSNHPTIQIYDRNTLNYTPNWSAANNALRLEAEVYLDSEKITPTTITWYTKIGDNEQPVNSTSTFSVSTNVLADNPIITYICKATYQGIDAQSQITFARTDTGVDGSSAPAVLAQYSVDGSSDWTTTLNTQTHKYVRYSYDAGLNWTAAIKVKGDDGTSIVIKNTAYTDDALIAGATVVLYSDSAKTTYVDTNTLETGDSYIVEGYLCVYNQDTEEFICTGKVQGPAGHDGVSSYVFIRYATSIDGANVSTNPSGKTYMGIYTSNTNVAPTTASSYTWSKFVGEDAKLITLNGDSQVFKVSKTNAITPSTIKVTAQTLNTSVTAWTYSTNGGQTFATTAPAGVSRSGNVVTITGSSITANSVTVKATDGVYSDVYTVYKAFDGNDGATGTDGESASMAFLTNENVTFSANASGQITATSVTTNVVAYNGTTKTTPTVGTISGLPSGMTATVGTAVNNEIPIVFTISNNATLGSALNNNGSITIPINGPLYTNLIFSWSKVNSGATGVGIRSVQEYYALSTTQDTAPTTWSTTIPVINAENPYLWNYEKITYTNNTTSETDPVILGMYSGDGRGIASVDNYYLAVGATSGVTKSTAGWSTSVPQITATNKYLWMYERINYTKGDPEETEPFIIGAYGDNGQKGADGRGIVNIVEYYAVSSSSTTAPTTWQNTVPTTTTTNRYLWNYETITYTTGNPTETEKRVIGVHGATGSAGRGISAINNYYLATASASGVTHSTTGWTTTVQNVTSTNKYLWNYEEITYTTGNPTKTDPIIIGAYGDTGATGTAASLVQITPSALYFKSTTGKDGTFTPEYIYLYPRFQSVSYSNWQYSTNGGTSWTNASGANGLTIGSYNGVANSLRIARGSTLYTDSITSVSFRCNSNNSSVYDIVSIAKIYDVVDIQIGGRNLLLDTGFINEYKYSDTTPHGKSLFVSNNIPLEQLTGKEVIFSYFVSCLGDWVDLAGSSTSNRFGFHGTMRWKNSTTNELSGFQYPFTTYLSTKGLNDRVSMKLKLTPPSGFDVLETLSFSFQPYAVPSTTNTNVWRIGYPKLELGNKATDWTPAPEDVDNTINNIQVGGRNYFRMALVRDLAFTYSPTVVSFVSGSTYKTFCLPVTPGEVYSVSRTAATNQRFAIGFSTDNPAHGVVITGYQDVRDQLKIEGVTVPTGANWLCVYVTNIDEILPNIKVEKGNKATDWSPAPEDIDENIDLAVQGIHIGGRNLIVGTNQNEIIVGTYPDTNYFEGKTYKINQALPESEYVLSFDAKSTVSGDKIVCHFYNPNSTLSALSSTGTTGTTSDGRIEIAVTDQWTRYWIKYTQTPNIAVDYKYVIIGRRMAGYGSGSLSIRRAKLEVGNKPTDWAPAPEDLIEEASNTTVMLSNEAHLFEADANGTPIATSVVLDVIGYKGSIQSPTTVGTISGRPSAGMTTTISNNGANNTKITIAITEALTSAVADYGTLTIPITVNGKTINKIFSWAKSKAGEAGTPGADAVTFRIHSSDGYALSINKPSITLSTFAMLGSTEITAGATYKWYSGVDGVWTLISDATGTFIQVDREQVNVSRDYKCIMTFNGADYEWVVTVDDKNDTSRIFNSKPSNYAAGDVWFVHSDYVPPNTEVGAILTSEKSNTGYADTDWVKGTNYDDKIAGLQDNMKNYNKYFSFDQADGLKIRAVDDNGVESKFSTTLSNEQLSFNENNESVAYISGKKMHMKEAEIESPLTVTGKYSGSTMTQAPIINIGPFSLVVESNGSLSVVVNT